MKTQRFPNLERISILTALILLTYTLAQFIDLPSRTLGFSVFNILINFSLNTNTIVAILAASIAASGANWVLSEHPQVRRLYQFSHWLLPGLTAWVLGITLNAIQPGRLWWIVLLIGAAMLLVVLAAEYIVVDAGDANFLTATIGLTTLSFILFLVLAINLRAAQVRYYLLMPTLSLAVGLITIRFLYLRLQEQDLLTPENVITAAAAALTTMILNAQILTALHYWPISAVGFGLALIGPAYAVTNFLGSMTEGKSPRQSFLEPVVAIVIFWSVAFWVR